jgi:hypothetical protein
MTNEQLQTLNITQQVLRHVLVAVAAAHPGQTAVLATTLAAASGNRSLDPLAQQMLGDLAEGLGMLASASHQKQ